MGKVYLGLGSNMGDRGTYLNQAIDLIGKVEGIQINKVSSLYETDPVGYEDQPPFLNLVVEIETLLKPLQLLAACQEIELALKRVRKIRWGPRTIDIDILTIENYTSQSDELTVPHPRMTERGFVLIPLAEIASELVVNGRTVLDWSAEVDPAGIKKI